MSITYFHFLMQVGESYVVGAWLSERGMCSQCVQARVFVVKCMARRGVRDYPKPTGI